MIQYRTKNGQTVRFRMVPAPIGVTDVEVDGQHVGEIERDGAGRFFAWAIQSYGRADFRSLFEAVDYIAGVE